VSSNEPVTNECEMIYETFHISLHANRTVINNDKEQPSFFNLKKGH